MPFWFVETECSLLLFYADAFESAGVGQFLDPSNPCACACPSHPALNWHENLKAVTLLDLWEKNVGLKKCYKISGKVPHYNKATWTRPQLVLIAMPLAPVIQQWPTFVGYSLETNKLSLLKTLFPAPAFYSCSFACC